VQGTPGAELIPELDIKQVDNILEKGLRQEVEMYSAFYDPFLRPRCSDSGLADLLREKGITDVYVVGLAFDYCVKSTAVDAAREGFKTVIVQEGTRAVDEGNWESVVRELEVERVRVVKMDGEEVGRVRVGVSG
jgi:nicotinamidase-related amidase